MLKLRLSTVAPKGLDIVTDRPSDYPEAQCFHTWTAWIVELLEKDDEAEIVVAEQTERLRVDREGSLFLRRLLRLLTDLMDPSESEVELSFPFQGREVEIVHTRTPTGTFRVKTFDGLPQRTNVVYDRTMTIAEIFSVYGELFRRLVSRAAELDPEAMAQKCMVVWAAKVERLLEAVLQQTHRI